MFFSIHIIISHIFKEIKMFDKFLSFLSVSGNIKIHDRLFLDIIAKICYTFTVNIISGLRFAFA